jgi:hypothetical protein
VIGTCACNCDKQIFKTSNLNQSWFIVDPIVVNNLKGNNLWFFFLVCTGVFCHTYGQADPYGAVMRSSCVCDLVLHDGDDYVMVRVESGSAQTKVLAFELEELDIIRIGELKDGGVDVSDELKAFLLESRSGQPVWKGANFRPDLFTIRSWEVVRKCATEINHVAKRDRAKFAEEYDMPGAFPANFRLKRA